LQTVDVLVARSDIGPGQSVTSENLQWQTWPAENETGDRALRRGESINVVRYGVLNATTTQK
jgi:pilus assembly protein CpaB